ncbi:MAG: hypothetical protein HGGPFJEG_00492 [Ignavibacteria bacterium]|nr:hypothetical protein [Ignavibacteria bacterium]
MFPNFYPTQNETISISEYYEFQTNVILPNKNISGKIKIINQLHEFLNLNENWDSYGAQPLNKKTIEKAIEVVNVLDRNNIEVYYTAPSPSGDILLESRMRNKILEIEILVDDKITFTAYENDDVFKSGNLIESDYDIINWFLS